MREQAWLSEPRTDRDKLVRQGLGHSRAARSAERHSWAQSENRPSAERGEGTGQAQVRHLVSVAAVLQGNCCT